MVLLMVPRSASPVPWAPCTAELAPDVSWEAQWLSFSAMTF
jgi:hypothetical protein